VVDLITPPLDGTILPGITRDSTLALARAHTSGTITLPSLSGLALHTHERPIPMGELAALAADNRILEAFGVGTAVIVAPVGRIGWRGQDIALPAHAGGLGPIGRAFWDMLTAVQRGEREFEGWSVPCVGGV
jgi:branched-chain amino acid aminotransferase